jgi:citrate lyase subunit beta/citryl-CoA lyase
MKPMRSMLFTPGHRLDLIHKAESSGADAVIADLEDAVAPEMKSTARNTVAALDGLAVQLYVRVNSEAPLGYDSALWADVAAAARADADGVVVPKAEDPTLMRRIDGALTVLELETGRVPGKIAIVPLIESAAGVLAARELLQSSPRIRAVLFGSGEDGDLVADLGCRWSPEGTSLMYARSHVLLAARATGIEPMDAVFMDFRNDAGLRAEAELARDLGYVGKAAIHPAQVGIINDVFVPTAEELAHHERIVREFDAAVASGSASINVDGRMVDIAVARVSQGILDRARLQATR